MFKIKLKVEVPDFNKMTVDIKCPQCKFSHSLSLGDIRFQRYLVCRGCKGNIKLVDHNHSMDRGLRKIKKTLEHLGR